jgi:hypothetical protein
MVNNMAFVTVKEASERYGKEPETIRKWAEQGKIKSAGQGTALTISDEGMPEVKLENQSNVITVVMPKVEMESVDKELLKDQAEHYAQTFRGDLKKQLVGTLWEDKALWDYKKYMLDTLNQTMRELDIKYNNPVMVAWLVFRYLQEYFVNYKMQE